MTRAARESRALSDALGVLAARQDELEARGREEGNRDDARPSWTPAMVGVAVVDGRVVMPRRTGSAAPTPTAPAAVIPAKRVMWTEDGITREISGQELNARLAAQVTAALEYTPKRRKDEDVRAWIAGVERTIVSIAATGLLEADRAKLLLDVLHRGDAPTAQPIVNVHVQPTPVHIHNAIDASPRGDLVLDYGKDGRLEGAHREPAKAGV